jgi:hypothetical protein
MSASTKLVEKLEGIDNFCAWKYRIGLILAENDLAKFIKEEVEELEDAVEKAKHQKDSIRAQRIIADSIKDNLIPYVFSKKTPKEMFNSLCKLYEGKNQSKDESKNSIEEYQDAERRNDSRIFLSNLRNKRTVESDWRHHRRRRIHNNNPKWYRKTLG